MTWFWLRKHPDPTPVGAEACERVLARDPGADGAHVTFSGGHDTETRSRPPPGFFGAHPETEGVESLYWEGGRVRRVWLPSAIRHESSDVKPLFAAQRPLGERPSSTPVRPQRQHRAAAGHLAGLSRAGRRPHAQGRVMRDMGCGMASSKRALIEAAEKRANKLRARGPSSTSRSFSRWGRTKKPRTSATRSASYRQNQHQLGAVARPRKPLSRVFHQLQRP